MVPVNSAPRNLRLRVPSRGRIIKVYSYTHSTKVKLSQDYQGRRHAPRWASDVGIAINSMDDSPKTATNYLVTIF